MMWGIRLYGCMSFPLQPDVVAGAVKRAFDECGVRVVCDEDSVMAIGRCQSLPSSA